MQEYLFIWTSDFDSCVQSYKGKLGCPLYAPIEENDESANYGNNSGSNEKGSGKT